MHVGKTGGSLACVIATIFACQSGHIAATLPTRRDLRSIRLTPADVDAAAFASRTSLRIEAVPEVSGHFSTRVRGIRWLKHTSLHCLKIRKTQHNCCTETGNMPRRIAVDVAEVLGQGCRGGVSLRW